MSTNIIIGADLVPTKSNYHLFELNKTEILLGEKLYAKLKSADFTIFNLEVPLSDIESPIEKSGPHLIAPLNTIEGIKSINPHFFTLANNHIYDQGEQGMNSTIDILNKAGISWAGVGKNLLEAKKPFITEIKGIKVGIYCCAEHEFSIATEMSPGANPFDPLESLDHIANLKQQCDYVIVLYHGGKEHYRYPSPYLQKVCRKIVEKGANLVACQHTHCIGCSEQWNNGTIVYGQGNFLFDYSNSDFWKTSLLVDIYLEKDSKGKVIDNVKYIPLSKKDEKVRIAEDEKKMILSKFLERSSELNDSEKLEEHYQEFANKLIYEYLNIFYGKKSLFFRIINKLSGYRFNAWYMSHRYKKEDKIKIKNCLGCEAHREVIMQGLYSNPINKKL